MNCVRHQPYRGPFPGVHCLLLLICGYWALPSPPAAAAEWLVNDRRFTVPDGFIVELAAGTNLVSRPVSASFDDQGRLYVTDSSGSNESPAKQLANPTHRVLCLEDSLHVGQFDRSRVFADQVMFPQGCLWYQGSVYVAGPPSIWKFTDTKGACVADRREEWFKGGTLTGCANDIHGPYLGPEGYLYWTKGAFAEQTHLLGDGRTLHDRAAHIYRARPDGSGLDVIMSGGMDNPVELAFTPEGETVFTSTFIDFSQPGYRDGIGHAVWGGVYGKENDVLEDGAVKRTGPALLHPFYQAGPAAECALTRYQNAAFGADYRDNLFATAFNLRKVTRHVLRPQGAGYASTDTDFLVCDAQDFHPTDVLADADGSLLVVDTGGWYKLCCPSAQLAKPDVRGAIYRVRRQGAAALAPAERAAAYRRLTGPPALADYSLTVSLKRAALQNDSRNTAWFREILAREAQAAATNTPAAQIARAAAEGLGRARAKAGVPDLLAAAPAAASDPVLEHTLIYALIRIAAPAETRAGLTAAAPATRRAALIALEQMDGGGLTVAEALPAFTSPDAELRAAAVWMLRRHLDWAPRLAEMVAAQLSPAEAGPGAVRERAELWRTLAPAREVQEVLAKGLPGLSPGNQLPVLQAMAEARPAEVSPAWRTALETVLPRADAAVLPAALQAARALLPNAKAAAAAGLQPALGAIARDAGRTADLRLEALLALGTAAPVEDPEIWAFLSPGLAATEAPDRRTRTVQILQRCRLPESQLIALAAALPQVGPLELPRLLALFEQLPNEVVGRALLAGLHAAPATRSLPVGNLRAALAKFPAPVPAELDAWLPTLDPELGDKTKHLEALLTELGPITGDVRRGQAIFNGPRASCLACHQVGYLGGQVGPDLTRIGGARSRRDLLESIVYPSASFVRSFEPFIVTTKAGEEFTGVLKKDSPAEVILATGPGAQVRFARGDITALRPGTVSVMPQGLAEQLNRQELADLLAFLQAAR